MHRIRRFSGIGIILALVISLMPGTAMAADTTEQRITALEARIQVLEKALALSSINVVQLVQEKSPAVVSLYQVDSQDHVQTQGTGFVISADGTVLTNAHVVAGGYRIRVKTAKGQEADARTVMVDPFLDMAVLKVDEITFPVTLTLAKTKPSVGEPLVVIGNAWGYSGSVTMGIVSGVDRPDPYHYHHYVSLQTDAAINHGNSGGPILNNKGEVVAMATWSELKDETDSIAFGIPADQIAATLAKVKPDKGVVRPWLSISAREPYWARGGLTNDAGLLVTGARATGAAYQAGMRGGDWLTKVNGVSVNYLHELRQELEKYEPGTTITVTVERTPDGGRTWVPTNLSVKLGLFESAKGDPLPPYEYEEGTDDLF